MQPFWLKSVISCSRSVLLSRTVSCRCSFCTTVKTWHNATPRMVSIRDPSGVVSGVARTTCTVRAVAMGAATFFVVAFCAMVVATSLGGTKAAAMDAETMAPWSAWWSADKSRRSVRQRTVASGAGCRVREMLWPGRNLRLQGD